MTKQYGAVILKTAPGVYRSPEAERYQVTGVPRYSYEVTATFWDAGRLLLFAVICLNEQAANAYDNEAELKQL